LAKKKRNESRKIEGLGMESPPKLAKRLVGKKNYFSIFYCNLFINKKYPFFMPGRPTYFFWK
jgi:hypothetical protein